MNCLQKLNIAVFIFIVMAHAAIGQAVTVDNLTLTATSSLTMTISGDFKNQNGGLLDNSGIITVSGNWTNNASNSVFSSNAGTVQMIGTALQTINGTNSTSFYNLTLNNSGGSATKYALGTDQTVKNTLTLSSGETDLANHMLTIGTSSVAPGALSYSAGWIYGGTLKRWFATSTITNGASAGLFPVGSISDYRPFYVSAPTIAPGTGGTIAVSQTSITGNTAVSFLDIGTTIDRIYNSYWTVTAGNGLAGGNYNLRGEGTGFTGITDYTLLRLTLAGSSVGTNGSNGGSNVNPQVNRTGLAVSELTNSFHIGYPASAVVILPIELLSFNAIPYHSEVRLNWSTASEINTDYFSIERSSDGLWYEPIATHRAAGNSSNILYYSTVDNNPLPGMSFYRLKETDFDGYTSYSLPVTVHYYKNENEVELISAHSVNGQVSVTVFSTVNENFKLNFYDCIGQLISQTEGSLIPGYQEITMPLPMKPTGLFLVSIRTAFGVLSKKIF